MLTASEVRNIVKQEITDTQYIMANVQCKVMQTVLYGDLRCWVSFNTRCLKNKSKLKEVANEVVGILTENGFKAEYEKFADDEYEEYLRFKISWEE